MSPPFGQGLAFGRPQKIFSGALPVPVPSVLFGTAGDRFKANNLWNAETPGTVRFRLRVESVPGTAFKWLAGFNASSGGWIFTTEDTTGILTVGQLVCYAGIGPAGGLLRVGRKVILAEQVGNVITCHLTLDGSKARWYIDGYEAGLGQVNTGFGVAYTGPGYGQPNDWLGVGSNYSGLYTTPQSIIEVATSSDIMTPAQVLADAQKSIGTAMTNEVRGYNVTLTNPGSSWVARTGGDNLVKSGTPAIQSVATTADMFRTKRTINGWGDSILAGRLAGGQLGDGWRRRMQRNLYSASKGVTWVGALAAGLPANPDYDYWCDGHPGESLTTRLGTFATDITNSGSATTAMIIAYGINDLLALSRTANQLRADVATACGLVQAARPGVPICVVGLMDVVTGLATAPQRVELLNYQAGLGAMQTSLRGSGYNVVVADIWNCVSDPNDTLALFDGLHPTPAVHDTGYAGRTAIGAVIASAVATLL